MCLKDNHQILNFLDDFAGGDYPERAMQAITYIGELSAKCGLERSEQKAVQPTTRMIYLRIILNTM